MSILGDNLGETISRPADNDPHRTVSVPLPSVAMPTLPTSFLSGGTVLLREKMDVGRDILKMMEEQQQQNLKMVKEFTEIAKSMGWPTT